MWELAFNIPIPNWSELVSGFCLGTLVSTVVLVSLGLYWDKKAEKKDGAISFEDIEKLDGANTSEGMEGVH